MLSMTYLFKKQLPISQRFGFISCLPKVTNLDNFKTKWRPITILNAFYKLVLGCLIIGLNPPLTR